jgi:circadian clock protein KaiC
MHEHTLREFRIGPKGIEVGQQLTDFKGVIGGVAQYRGPAPLLGDAEASR